ncbi:MAG: RNA-binding RNA processing protein rpp1 [Sporothrix thermara]
MCIVFTCGEHTFRKEVEGYGGVVCRCFNCGNYSARVIKTHPWFTLCFVALEHREDVQAMRYGNGGGGGGPPPGPGGQPGIPMQPQNYKPPHGQQPGPNGGMRYS